jgi:acetyltransferase-like isoleucine patch superfamily enzyme
VQPKKIELGARVEILRHTTLDARSSKDIGIRIGDRSRIKENVWFACYGGSLTLETEVFVSRNVVLEAHGDIEIGAFCSLGPNVVIVSHRHVTSSTEHWHTQGFIPEPVILEEDVYVGAGAFITAGVHIGPRTLIGANSVVTHSLKGGYVYGGAPAKPLHRTTDGAGGAPIRFHEDWHQG